MAGQLLNAARGASNRVLLTRLGGGAFGNEDAWIDDAMLRALQLVHDQDLEVDVVSYGPPSSALREMVQTCNSDLEFGAADRVRETRTYLNRPGSVGDHQLK